MSELFDKQVNAQKEKNFQGSHKLSQAQEKCAMTMKESRRIRKNDTHVKMVLIGGKSL